MTKIECEVGLNNVIHCPHCGIEVKLDRNLLAASLIFRFMTVCERCALKIMIIKSS